MENIIDIQCELGKMLCIDALGILNKFSYFVTGVNLVTTYRGFSSNYIYRERDTYRL